MKMKQKKINEFDPDLLVNSINQQKRKLKVSIEKKDTLFLRATLPSQITKVIVDGKTYKRFFWHGNLAAEKIVVLNLEKFIKEVKRVVKNALASKTLSQQKNTLQDIEKLCLDFEGINPEGFISKDGKALKKNKAFAYTIHQFFKDEEFALKVVRDALKEFEFEKFHKTK